MHKEHEEHFAEQYRLAQANKCLRLFREANGRDARDMKELEAWVKHHDHEKSLKPDAEDFDAIKRQG